MFIACQQNTHTSELFAQIIKIIKYEINKSLSQPLKALNEQ